MEQKNKKLGQEPAFPKKCLKRGQIAVNKKRLHEHCKLLRNCLLKLDKTMTEKESVQRGKKVAEIANEINYSLDIIEHFELNVPLNKL